MLACEFLVSNHFCPFPVPGNDNSHFKKALLLLSPNIHTLFSKTHMVGGAATLSLSTPTPMMELTWEKPASWPQESSRVQTLDTQICEGFVHLKS